LRAQPQFRSSRFEPGFGRSVAIAEFSRPGMSDDVETAQTITLMDELASRDAPTRIVVAATQRALDEAGIDAAAPALDKACAIFWFLKRCIRYVPVPGTSPLVDQTLIPPASLLDMPDPEGDCAQFSMLANAMLRVACVSSFFKTIAADPDFPETFTHVYNVVEIGDGSFMPFDSSNGPEPGAEYARRFKSRVWPQLNRPRCKETSMMRTIRPNQHQRPRGYRNSALRGSLGIAFLPLSGLHDVQCDQDGNCYTDGVLTSSPPSTAPSGYYEDPAELGQYSSPPITSGGSSSSSGANPYSLAAALAADAASVAAPLTKALSQQAPYYITNPATGQSVLYNPNTGATASGVSSLASLTGSLSPTTLLIGLALLAALAVVGKK